MTASRSSGTIVAGVVFAAMIAGALYRYWPSDDREIHRHLSNLAEALSLPMEDVEVTRITRFAALAEYFAPDVRVRADGREIVSRDELIGELEAVQPPPGGIAVEFVDISVGPITDGANARVTLTAKVSTSKTGTIESEVEERLVELQMRKASGDWVIVSADAVPMPAPAPASTP